MNIALSPDGPEFNGPKKKTFEQLIKDLKPQLSQIPEDMRVPALPPTEAAAADVKEYVRKKMGLPVAETVPNWMLIGNESIERSKIREGRIGEIKGTRAFAFLYPYGKAIKTVCIYPKDGICPRMIAKAVMWGQVDEIPSSTAHSELMDVSQFFVMKCFNLKQLMDLPLLEKAMTDYRQKYEEENQSLRSRLAYAERLLAAPAPTVEIQPPIDLEQLKAEAIREQNRAEHWKLFGIIAAGTAIAALIPAVNSILHSS